MTHFAGIDQLTARLAAVGTLFTHPFSRLGWAVLLIGWGIAAIVWLRRRSDTRPAGSEASLAAFLRYAFPARVYFSRSAAVDVQLMLFNVILGPARWLVFGVTVAASAKWIASLLATAFGPMQLAVPGTLGTMLLGLALFLAYDLGTYVTHRLSHEVPLLWAFHRVHHSAPTLNPVTLMRKHPCYDACGILIDCLIVAPLAGLVVYAWGQQVSLAALAASGSLFAIFAFAASSLRHTHIWLSFGPLFDRIFVSPAMHQIHHSRAERHIDRNYGEVLAIWDVMFRSFYREPERVTLEFGLSHESEQPHRGLLSALIEPFHYAARRMWRTLAKTSPAEIGPIDDAHSRQMAPLE